MQTRVTASSEEAAGFLRRGHVVAFPTETVYGLGADAFDSEAVRRIFALKGRPKDNPLIVHVSNVDQIGQVARHVSVRAASLIDRFFPGPLTIVLEKQETLPTIVTAGLDTVAVRMPAPPLTLEFLNRCGTPVAAPSANPSGRPSPTTWEDVIADFQGRIPCVLKGPRSPLGLESTVLDCTTDVPILLRAGSISLEMLQDVVPVICPHEDEVDVAARSPGMRHRHYAPSARICIVKRAEEARPDRIAAYIGTDAPGEQSKFGLVNVCGDLQQYAFELYHFFRSCDRLGIKTIYCQSVEKAGLGRALMDRIARAARKDAA